MKRKLLLAALCVIGALGMRAQTDVTSTYITNAGFDESNDFQTGNVATGDSNQRKSVTGWTNSGGNTYTTGAAIGFGTSGQINGANLPSTNAGGTATGGALCLNAAWTSQVWYSQDVTLPAGNYTMTFAVNNVGKNAQFEKDPVMFSFTTTTGASFSGNVHSYPVNTWTTQTITFALASETEGTIKIGYKAGNTGSGNTPKLIVDYVKAVYNSNYTETLKSTIDRATILNARASDDDLATAITTAQGVLDGADNTVAYQATIDNAVSTLRSAISTAAAKIVLLEGENITFMFENADFESSTPVTVGITTYDYDAATNGTSFSRMQIVEGWTVVENGNAKSAGVFEFGKTPFLGSTGTSYQAPATGSATGETKALGIVAVWQSSAQYKQECTLPAGSYIIEVPVYNTAGTTAFAKNLIGFVENGGTEHLATAKTYATGSWITEKIIFELENETSGYMSLGYTAANSGSGAMPHLFIDNVKVTYTSPIAAAYQKYQDALAAANTAISATDYDNVTGSERTALQNAIDATPEETKEAYNSAADALDVAREAFTGAKAAYDAFVAAKATTVPDLTYAAAAKRTTLEEAIAATATSAEEATTNTAAITTALRAYYESHAKAEGVEGAVDYASAISAANADPNTGWTNGIGTNQGQGYTDSEGNVASLYLDGGWATNAGANIDMTRTVAVPAGKYLLTVKARGAVDLTEYTLSIASETINLPHANGGSNGVFGNGWDDASVEFESDGTEQTLEIIAKSEVSQQWISLNDFRLVRLELYTEMATAADYEALNTAITAAEAKTLGFEAGEYAPYNNRDAISALATAKTIDQDAENAKADIEALTTALGNWTANNDEVNGIYNGDWANSTPNTQSGVNVDVPGWTIVDGMRLLIDDTAIDPGLEYASANKALFSWGGTTITYGEQTGYTLPLKANTVYEVSYLISGWRDGDLPSWVSLTVPDATVYGDNGISGLGRVNDAEDNPFKTKTFKFKTGEAKNYVIQLSANKHFVITDIELTKVAETSANMTVKAGKYGTFVAPFEVTIPKGYDIEAYTVDEDNVEENVLVLNEALSTIPANTPVVLKNSDSRDFSQSFSGQSIATADIYTVGLLTGVYTNAAVPAGSYVLQTQDGVQGFYQVEGNDFTAIPNRAYLTVPATSDANVRALFFPADGDATGIEAIGVLTSGNYDSIYTAGGAKVNSLQKGLNIVVKDGKSYKIFVK